jgi:hypothetical protein
MDGAVEYSTRTSVRNEDPQTQWRRHALEHLTRTHGVPVETNAGQPGDGAFIAEIAAARPAPLELTVDGNQVEAMAFAVRGSVFARISGTVALITIAAPEPVIASGFNSGS